MIVRLQVRISAGASFAPRSTQPSIPPGSANEYRLRLGRQRQVYGPFRLRMKRMGVQVRLRYPLTMRAIYMSALEMFHVCIIDRYTNRHCHYHRLLHAPRVKSVNIDSRRKCPTLCAPCGLRGCKNGPAPFPGQMSYRATKPGLVSVLYLSNFFYCDGVY